jgi:hypothetical protein
VFRAGGGRRVPRFVRVVERRTGAGAGSTFSLAVEGSFSASADDAGFSVALGFEFSRAVEATRGVGVGSGFGSWISAPTEVTRRVPLVLL